MQDVIRKKTTGGLFAYMPASWRNAHQTWFVHDFLAEKTGLSQQDISYMEREMRTPNLDTLLRIANSLDVSLGDIINQADLEIPMATSKPRGEN